MEFSPHQYRQKTLAKPNFRKAEKKFKTSLSWGETGNQREIVRLKSMRCPQKYWKFRTLGSYDITYGEKGNLPKSIRDFFGIQVPKRFEVS